MSGNPQEIASAVKEVIEANGQVSGSRLSDELKNRVPGWSPSDFGSRNLREFIATHVTGVVVVGRSGMDVIYGLEGAVPLVPAAPTTQAAEVDFWRIWVSPNSPHALAVEQTGVGVRAVPRREPVLSSQLLVQPPSGEAHREVAKAFLSSVPPPLQERLRAILGSPSETWWQAWIRELRGTDHLREWNTFRSRQLEDLLAARLREAGLTKASVDGVLELVRERHKVVGPQSRRTAAGQAALDDNGDAIRRIVIEAAQRMSVSELRELRLPLGVVLDALAILKPR